MKTCVGIMTNQPHTDQKPTAWPKTQFVEWKKVPLLFCFSRVFQKKWWRDAKECMCFFFCETAGQKWQAESRHVKEKIGTSCDGPGIPFGTSIYF